MASPDTQLIGNYPPAIASALKSVADRTYTVTLDKYSADATAATASAERPVFRAADACTVTAAYFLPGGALTADNTDYAVLRIQKRDGVGGSASTVASYTTNVAGGSLTAQVTKSLGTITNASVAAGSILTFEITKGGSGVAVPAGQLLITYTVD